MGLPWPCGIAVAPALSLEPCVLSLVQSLLGP